MNKSTFFTGQPILNQLLISLNKREIKQVVQEHGGDHYYKKFDTWHHLVTMLYTIYQHCTSLREVTTGMQACEGRLQSLGIKHFVRRSTLSDANAKRDSVIFEKIFYKTYQRLYPFLPDSQLKGSIFKKLIIVDSTTITLFQEILKAAVRQPADGKRKGGVKIHMAVKATEDVPSLVMISSAASNDSRFLSRLNCNTGSYVVFDKGYNGFKQFHKWNQQKVYWVTRLRANTVVTVLKDHIVNESEKQAGVIADQMVIIGHKSTQIQKVKCRMITYYDSATNRTFTFLCNNHKIKASTIAAIYKQRWQIELLFKRMKQNLQLQYFLGDNENAIKIHIWCTLIADLLMKIAINGVKRRWAFSNMASVIRLHLMNYTDLKRFLNNPEKTRIIHPAIASELQLNLFHSG